MKIQKNKSSKKAVLIILISLFVVALGSSAYALFIRSNNSDAPSTTSSDTQQGTAEETPAIDTPSTEEQVQDGEDIKKDTIEEDQSNTESTSSTSVIITRALQSSNKSTVSVGVLIDAVTTGSCTLTATNVGKTYTKTVDIQALSSSSTCEGFTVPVSSLGSGEWSISVSFKSSTKDGAASVKLNVE